MSRSPPSRSGRRRAADERRPRPPSRLGWLPSTRPRRESQPVEAAPAKPGRRRGASHRASPHGAETVTEPAGAAASVEAETTKRPGRAKRVAAAVPAVEPAGPVVDPTPCPDGEGPGPHRPCDDVGHAGRGHPTGGHADPGTEGHCIAGEGFDCQGCDCQGCDCQGRGCRRYGRQGRSGQGCDSQGCDPEGCDRQGHEGTDVEVGGHARRAGEGLGTRAKRSAAATPVAATAKRTARAAPVAAAPAPLAPADEAPATPVRRRRVH